MGISRSSCYAAHASAPDDTAIVEAIAKICDEFECYGWRRVRAELRHRGMTVCLPPSANFAPSGTHSATLH
jgi:putative transposase